jgi:glucokinase
MSGVLVGFDIGGTKCAVSTGCEENGTVCILSREEFKTPHSQEEAISRMCSIGAKAIVRKRILGVGLSAGNPMDSEKGMLCNPPNLPGLDWRFPDRLGDAGIGARLPRWKTTPTPARLRNGAGARDAVRTTWCLLLSARMRRRTDPEWQTVPRTPRQRGRTGTLAVGGIRSRGIRQARFVRRVLLRRRIRQLAVTIGERYRQLGLPCAYLDMQEISARTVAEAARAGDKAANEVFGLCAKRLGRVWRF